MIDDVEKKSLQITLPKFASKVIEGSENFEINRRKKESFYEESFE